MSQTPHNPDQEALFDWPGEKPIERTIGLFASDTIAGIAGRCDAMEEFLDETKGVGYYATTSGPLVRVSWTLRNLRSSAYGRKSPRIIEANFEPEQRDFSFFARLDFDPYFDVQWDAQRSCHVCSPTRVTLQGGGGDMEACHRWLMMWKLYR